MSPVELTLRPATHVTGSVYQPTGQPAAGFQLEGVNADRGEPVVVVTGPDGSSARTCLRATTASCWARIASSPESQRCWCRSRAAEQRLNIGPVPGSGSLNVVLKPERGKALWVVAGTCPRWAVRPRG